MKNSYKKFIQFLENSRWLLSRIWAKTLGISRKKQYIILEHEKLIYIPISKCGNTSIKNFLYNLINPEYIPPYEYAIHKVDFPCIYARKLPEKYLNNYTIFTVIRNPLERLISCYYSKYHTDAEKIKKNEFDSSNRWLDFDNYLFWYLRKDPGSVEMFLKKIIQIPTWLMEQHFQPMSEQIGVDKITENILIINLENMKDFFHLLEKKYRLKPLEIKNKTKEDKKIITANLPDNLKEKIKKIYSQDFILYEKSLINTNEYLIKNI